MIERYNHGQHYFLVKKWLEAHGLKVPDKRLFYDFGLVVENAAIGFLCKTNSGGAWIDHVVADPVLDKKFRDEAINTLFVLLEKEAVDDGFVMVSALATLPAMRRRFERGGYSKHGEFGLYYKLVKGE